MPSICLSVCYWQFRVKTTDWILMKILREMYLWTRKIALIFGIHTHPYRNDLET